jgi:hypothetical protein
LFLLGRFVPNFLTVVATHVVSARLFLPVVVFGKTLRRADRAIAYGEERRRGGVRHRFWV